MCSVCRSPVRQVHLLVRKRDDPLFLQIVLLSFCLLPTHLAMILEAKHTPFHYMQADVMTRILAVVSALLQHLLRPFALLLPANRIEFQSKRTRQKAPLALWTEDPEHKQTQPIVHGRATVATRIHVLDSSCLLLLLVNNVLL